MIADAVIDDEVAHARFACDVARCKGACCTLPGRRGAPLEDRELPDLAKAFLFARNYLPARNLEVIERHGLFEGEEGDYATTCVDHRDCVFVFYEGDVARCSFEAAFHDGQTDWRKPLSCHLFPIRISAGVVQYARYEKIPECAAGREKGHSHNQALYLTLRDSLIRKFGEPWYLEFEAGCRQRDSLGQTGSADPPDLTIHA